MLPYNELFIDSGVNSGYAFFTRDRKIPINGTIYVNKKLRKTLENYIKFMGIEFTNILKNFNPVCITIEHPEFWNDSEKSKTSVESGSLLHNAANAYSYAGICQALGYNFTLVYARQWKGQLSKEATEYRVKEILGRTFKNDHIIDAIGIGLSKDKDIWQLRKSI